MFNMGLRPTGIITVQKGKGDKVLQELKFTNIVLNVGWDYIYSRTPDWGFTNHNFEGATFQGYSNITPMWLYLGTGTSEPKATDLGLQSVSPTLDGLKAIAVFAVGVYGGDGSAGNPYFEDHGQRFDYGAGDAAGTWTELGLAYGEAYTDPYNRALFRDTEGNPIAITVLGDEWLRIFVRLRMYYPNTDSCGKSGEALFNGAPFNWQFSYTLPTSHGGKTNNFWRTNGLYPYMRLNGGGLVATRSGSNAQHTRTFTFHQGPGDLVSNYGEFRISNTRHNTSTHTATITTTGAILAKQADESFEGSVTIKFFRGCTTQDSGTVSSAAPHMLTDTSKSWAVDQYAGMRVTLLSDAECAPSEERRIVSNDADTLIVDPAWEATPDNTFFYEICGNG